MTCIVGLVENGRVFLGADSSAVAGWTVRRSVLPKVFCIGDFAIGYTTSFRMGQILRYRLKAPPQAIDDDVAYMVGEFVESVRQCLKEGGFSSIENNVETGGQFLVGYRGRLYFIESDFQVNVTADGMEAIGCGAEYALGALVALRRMPPRRRITCALKAAAYFNGAVIPPFNVVEK